MAPVTARISARAERDFGDDATSLIARLGALDLPHEHLHERVHAAILIQARGGPERFDDALSLARTDWRDVLMGTGLEHADWESRLEGSFGSTGH